MEKTSINLDGSKEILKYPSGEYNEKVLEKILYDATLKEINENKLIITTSEERVKDFNSSDPQWQKVKHNIELKELFNLYEKIGGQKYKQPTPEELEQKYRRGYFAQD